MFYFVKNKTAKTKTKMIRKIGEKKNIRREREREERSESVHRSCPQSEEKKIRKHQRGSKKTIQTT
jgi:hypothetical protein